MGCANNYNCYGMHIALRRLVSYDVPGFTVQYGIYLHCGFFCSNMLIFENAQSHCIADISRVKAVADPGGDPRVPRIPLALLQLRTS